MGIIIFQANGVGGATTADYVAMIVVTILLIAALLGAVLVGRRPVKVQPEGPAERQNSPRSFIGD